MTTTDSDGYDATDSSLPYRRGIPSRRRGRTSSASTADQIDSITSDLKDTDRNLRSVGGLLEHYKDTNRIQSSAIDRLRENLAQSTHKLHNERLRRRSPPIQSSNRSTLRASDLESSRRRRYRATSPLRDYRSEVDTASTRTRFRPSVRFDENIDEIHEIHQTVRDLSSDNLRLGEELDREIQRRNQVEADDRRSLLQLSDSLRKSEHQDRGDKSSARVEKRLRDIQDELRRQRLHRDSRETRDTREAKTDDVISAKLKEAVQSQSQHQERELRERLLQAESEKQRLSSQLENAQRKLDQTEGTNTALSSQLDDVHDRLAKSDHERSHLVTKLSSYQEVLEEEGLPLNRHARRERKLLESQGKQDSHRQKLEIEIDSLRTQLNQASGLRELDQTRKELQRSEKQRYQLSEHLEKLKEELEDKERHHTKLISQLQESSEHLRDTEQERQQALSQLEDLQVRLRDTSRVTSGQEDRLQECEKRLELSERKRTQMKAKAQDTVKQWKLKCKKLEHEMDVRNQNSGQLSDQNRQLVKENESLKEQSLTLSHRTDTLQKEVNDILEKRAYQDEQVRVQDVEINKLKSAKQDLEQELRDTRNFMDKLDNELRTQQARYTALCDEKLRVEEDLGSSKSAQQRANIQVDQLQGDIKELSLQHAELSARLAEETNRKHHSEEELREAKKRENEIQEELASLARQLKENHEMHNKKVGEFQKEISALREREERTVRELLKRQKREKTELEAELEAMKIELAEDKSLLKSVRRQLERSKSDYDHLHNEFNKLEDENAKVKRNYDRIHMEFEEQAQMAEVDGNRASMLERHRRQLEDRVREQGMEYETILRKINREVDILVQILSVEKEDRYKAVITPTKDVTGKPQNWLADIKSKLDWIQEEVQSQLDCQSKIKRSLDRSHSDLQELLKANEVDKIQYEAQLAKQDETITDLKTNQQDIVLRNLDKREAVHSLERQVAQLEHHIESNVVALQNSAEQISMQDSLRALTPDEELERLKDLQRERDRINERYNRYRGTVTLLQQQLEEARRTTKSSRRLGNTTGDATVNRQRKDDVATSPPTRINHRKRRVAFEETTGSSTSTPVRKSALNTSYLSHSSHQDIT